MNWDELSAQIDAAIQQYQQACQYEEQLYDLMREAERDADRYNAMTSSSDDPLEQQEASAQAAEAAQRYFYYQNQLEQVQEAKQQSLDYLQDMYEKLSNVITAEEMELLKFDQSISTFEQMTSLQFGSNAASQQLSQLRIWRDQHQEALNWAETLQQKIDDAINGGGGGPQKILRR